HTQTGAKIELARPWSSLDIATIIALVLYGFILSFLLTHLLWVRHNSNNAAPIVVAADNNADSKEQAKAIAEAIRSSREPSPNPKPRSSPMMRARHAASQMTRNVASGMRRASQSFVDGLNNYTYGSQQGMDHLDPSSAENHRR